jgi:hypothetical protein
LRLDPSQQKGPGHPPRPCCIPSPLQRPLSSH